MLISVAAAAEYLDTNLNILYSNPKFMPYIRNEVKRDNMSMFDIDSFEKLSLEKEDDLNFCIDMVNFAEFVIEIIGEKEFYKKIPTLKRQSIKEGFLRSRFSLTRAKHIRKTFDEWYESYLSYEEAETEYIPFEQREPLAASFIMHNYWSSQKTTLEIAEELNVPQGWVISEIKRLGLQKRANGIIVKGGLKDTIMSKEQRQKRENQPHAKAIVQICPKTFEVVREYNSQGAVNRYGFRRENVRKAIKRGGLSGGYLWAFKDLEQITINVAKKRGNIEVKLQAAAYIKPSKKELEELYLRQGKTSTEIAKICKCHKNTIAKLCSDYKLYKPKANLSVEKLEHLYLKEKMMAKDIAKMYGLSAQTVSTYLSRNKIRKYK